MVDTFHPLQLTVDALDIENEGYVMSWRIASLMSDVFMSDLVSAFRWTLFYFYVLS